MFENQIGPRAEAANLKNYDKQYNCFSWDDVDREFSWHTTGRLNIAYEAIDRHAENPQCAERSCIVYSGRNRRQTITFSQMRRLSNRFGNVLRKLGTVKGDRVFIFMPNIPELYIAMVGCAKIGAIIAPLYSDYRERAIKERMLDGQGKVLVTSPRHRRHVPVDELPHLEHIIITGTDGPELEAGEIPWDSAMAEASEELDIEWVDREFPLFVIYTSGPDGISRGLLHPHDAMRGYLMTARWVLDLKPDDVLWTQARPGWLMNVVYSAFAPWLCGVTSLVTGKMTCTDDIYRRIQENGVTVWYTIPTVYRMIMDAGERGTEGYDLKSIRHLVSVLEPLFPDVIYALMRILGVPVYDTWWSAETGMITLANFPCLPLKPGYLGKPCPGMQAAILDDDGNEVPPFTMGELALKIGWPSMARGVWGKDHIYHEYMKKKPWFMSGDTAFMDFDGYFFYQGRADAVIITSAGKTGLAEIEKMINRHPAVAEAGIIRVPDKHGIKKIKAFVCLKEGYSPSPLMKKKIMGYVQNNLSPDTSPRDIAFCDSLPKDKDGNILRRVLKAWELGLPSGNIDSLKGS